MAEDEAKNGSDTQGTDVAKPTSLENKIIRQLEYYFGDSNLRRDRFLQLQIREDDGWVPWETMVKFNRLAQLSTDTNVLTTAIKKSNNGLIQVSEDNSKIRRSPDRPLPEENAEYWSNHKARTVYAKGFNLEDTIDKIEGFIDTFGEVEVIVMRRDKEKNFKGSIFVTFKSKESATNFLNKSVKYGETELLKYSKSDYFKQKSEERKQNKEQDKKKKKEEKEKKEEEAVDAQTEYKEFEKGLILAFTGAPEQLSREDLKEFFGDYGTISWVDYDRGRTEGSVRFDDEPKAKEILDKALGDHDGKIELRGKEMSFRVLEGDEEEEHWKEVFRNKARIRLRKHEGRRGRGRGKSRGGGQRRQHDVKFEGKKTVFKEEEGGGDKEEKMDAEQKTEPSSTSEKRPHEESEEVKEPPQKQVKTE